MTDFLEFAQQSLLRIAAQDRLLALRILSAIDSVVRHPTLGTKIPNENYWFYRTKEFVFYYSYNAATKDITIDKISTFR